MTSGLLWSPTHKKNKLQEYQKKISDKLEINSYASLHKWSVENKALFWSTIWDYTKIKGIKKDPIIKNENDFINSKFFDNSKLNFSENLIQKKDDSESIVFFSEQGQRRSISWRQLNKQVNKIAYYYISKGLKKGDRVAAILPNIPESVICFLACAKIGAIWSSCSSDFGTKAILDRFKQIEPKILIVSDLYFYNNKEINTLEKVDELLLELPNVIEVVIASYEGRGKKYNLKYPYRTFKNLIDKEFELKEFKKFDFNIPLYILFSSGTTGVPKCIVHGAGGSLIQHKKEHQLHCNINEGDKVFYFTTCGWMMWNWLVSALSSKATIYLYDGSPFYPHNEYLFEIIEKEQITFFGTGAKYLDHLKQNDLNIKKKYNLKKLNTIASTGSPLIYETYKYVYEYIKKNIHLASISGGTDIVSCFVLGNPMQSVHAGEIQCKGLGMDVDIFDEYGNSLILKKGELVCKSPFPSKPIYFYNDRNNQKYFNAYFSKYKNIWHHGDYASTTKENGYIIHGRSDATLNSGGVRIGTSEIYRVVENIQNVQECLATELINKNDTEIILFIKTNNSILDDSLIKIIKNKIKNQLSPKHIPKKIISVSDIPKTKSGKIVEIMVKKIINSEKIDNANSLINENCLDEYYEIANKLNSS